MPSPVPPENPRVAHLCRALRDELLSGYGGGRAVFAIDGEDGAGKTRFADVFADVFGERGVTAHRASIDGFHRPRAERYARGRHSPDGFYRDSYDYDSFVETLIGPFRAGGPFRTAVFDVTRDQVVDSPEISAGEDDVLIVDGIFLHRPELRDRWDWSVWLEAPAAVRYERMARRDGCDPDPSAPGNRRYLEGQRLYLSEAHPREAASTIIDNADHRSPVRTSVGVR